jgi:N utilization substance protein A
MTAALSPARLKHFEIDEAGKRVKIVVSSDQLSLAIGRRGQNARLTSKLTGWYVDIEEEAKAPELGFQEGRRRPTKPWPACPV